MFRSLVHYFRIAEPRLGFLPQLGVLFGIAEPSLGIVQQLGILLQDRRVEFR